MKECTSARNRGAAGDAPDCPFCAGAGGEVVWQGDRCRVVIAAEPFAGFCRVVWNAHVQEMTDLDAADRAHLMCTVFATEAALRTLLEPPKMNLASLGNAVPHLHWHVIPRFADDSHFPQSVWGAAQRVTTARPLPTGFADALRARLAADLGSIA
jgi:diadenosine tetraphosphate (Ap4A) HIT family hydrolase